MEVLLLFFLLPFFLIEDDENVFTKETRKAKMGAPEVSGKDNKRYNDAQ